MISNGPSLQRHLIEAFHIPPYDTEGGWDQVDYNCARFNFENPTQRKTAFLRNTTWPMVEHLILATIFSPSACRYTQNDGRLVAIQTFSTHVGQEVRFWNRYNYFNGYARTYSNTIKVVYVQRQHLLNVITTYPV